MNKLLAAAAALTFLATASHSAVAQDGGSEPLATCTVVIDLQYANGRETRAGECIGAVASWLGTIGAPSPTTDAQVVEAVIDLTELYRPEECPDEETELPEAIETAAAAIVDEATRAEIMLIAEQIRACDFVATAAVDDLVVPLGGDSLVPTSASPS